MAYNFFRRKREIIPPTSMITKFSAANAQLPVSILFGRLRKFGRPFLRSQLKNKYGCNSQNNPKTDNRFIYVQENKPSTLLLWERATS